MIKGLEVSVGWSNEKVFLLKKKNFASSHSFSGKVTWHVPIFQLDSYLTRYICTNVSKNLILPKLQSNKEGFRKICQPFYLNNRAHFHEQKYYKKDAYYANKLLKTYNTYTSIFLINIIWTGKLTSYEHVCLSVKCDWCNVKR